MFALGDVADTPNSKTVASIYSQAPVLVHNLLREAATSESRKKTTRPAKYDGYAGCPIYVGEDKVMLAEFTYDGAPAETFFKN